MFRIVDRLLLSFVLLPLVAPLSATENSELFEELDLFESPTDHTAQTKADVKRKLVVTSNEALAPQVRPHATSSRGLATLHPATRAANKRIDDALEQPLHIPLNYVDVPLNQIMQGISDDYDIPIVFDRQALDSLAISEETEVSVNLRNISRRAAIELILRQVEDLTYLVDSGVVMITNEDEAQQRLEVRVYRIDDLLKANTYQIPAGASAWADFDPIIDLITATVEPSSWRENGRGDGDLRRIRPGMLVISQTRRVHQQIENLLATVREVKAKVDAEQPINEVGVTEKPLEDQPLTKSYQVTYGFDFQPERTQEMIRETVMKSVDWKANSKDRDDVFVEVIQGRVVVRHLPAVQQQVKDTLAAMNLLYEEKPSRPLSYGEAVQRQSRSNRKGGF